MNTRNCVDARDTKKMDAGRRGSSKLASLSQPTLTFVSETKPILKKGVCYNHMLQAS